MTLLSELWDTTRMRLLVEIDRRGSLSAAAQAVGIGQPSASQHLRTLEAAAGQRLVERNGRGSRLTEGGRVLATHAAHALAALAAGEQELGALAGLQTGTIHLGVLPARVWELGSTEAVKRAAREGLGVAFLSAYAVAEEIERGELDVFRLRGRRPLTRDFHIARLASRPLSPAETAFVATLTRCCAKQAAYAEACVAG